MIELLTDLLTKFHGSPRSIVKVSMGQAWVVGKPGFVCTLHFDSTPNTETFQGLALEEAIAKAFAWAQAYYA